MDWKQLIVKLESMNVVDAVTHLIEEVATELKKLIHHDPVAAENTVQELHNEAHNLTDAVMNQPAKAKTKGSF